MPQVAPGAATGATGRPRSCGTPNVKVAVGLPQVPQVAQLYWKYASYGHKQPKCRGGAP